MKFLYAALKFALQRILQMVVTLLKCVYLFELVSQVRNVAHGPLVVICQVGTFFNTCPNCLCTHKQRILSEQV